MKMGVFIVGLTVLYWGVSSIAQSMLATAEPCEVTPPMWAEASPQSELHMAQGGVVTPSGLGCAE